jgi:hypothetical protein
MLEQVKVVVPFRGLHVEYVVPHIFQVLYELRERDFDVADTLGDFEPPWAAKNGERVLMNKKWEMKHCPVKSDAPRKKDGRTPNAATGHMLVFSRQHLATQFFFFSAEEGGIEKETRKYLGTISPWKLHLPLANL